MSRRPRLAVFLVTASMLAPAFAASVAAQVDYQRIANLSTIGGSVPLGGLVRGSDGALYGTTSEGGTGLCGLVYRLTLAGQLSVIHQFARTQGCYPVGDLAVGPDGALYGITYLGGLAAGNGFGTVYKVTLQGVHTVLKVFSGAADGRWPAAGLTLGPDGNFYGTTLDTVFRISPQGAHTVLESGVESQAALTLGADGLFYGTLRATPTGAGAIFRISLTGDFAIVHELPYVNSSPPVCLEGSEPMAELVPAPDGNFYSTTRLCGPDLAPGGTYTEGTIFRITPGAR